MNVLGDVEVTVAREMTKVHEEFVHGRISEVIGRVNPRGEMTIVFAAALRRQIEVAPDEIAREFERLRAAGMRRNDAVKAVAEKFGLRKNDVYKMLTA